MRCYILAGGQSRRMGSSKLTIPFGGSTFFDRTVEAASAAFDSVVAVQRAGGSPLPRVPTVFEQARSDPAPLFGVLRALEEQPGKCFVVAADYPLIDGDFLRFLRAAASASSASLVVPRWGGKLQMLCAAYDASLRAAIEQRVASGRLDLRGLVNETESEIVEEPELRARFGGEPLMNVNTPEELQQARELHERT